jgi:hypothetical protein
MVPFQNIPIRTIIRQAKRLNCPLCLVPLAECTPNDVYLKSVNDALTLVASELKLGSPLSLVFGDLRLDDIRRWREQSFPQLSVSFPLWGRPYETELLPKLWNYLDEYEARAEISAVDQVPRLPDFIRPGQVYDQNFVDKLRDAGYDLMGENREFHTCIEFQEEI